MLDEQDKPVVKPEETPKPEVDAQGNPIVKPEVDEQGNPIVKPIVKEEEVKPVVKEPSDKEVDSLTGFIKDAGLEVADVIQQITDNNGLFPPTVLKALIAKHGESVSNLIVAQITQIMDVARTRAAAKDAVVYKLVEDAFVGVTTQTGKETWNELATWAKDNVETSVRKEINSLLAMGGLQAELAVKHLVGLFKGRQGGDMQSAVLLDGDGVLDTVGGTPIDKRTYILELDKLLAAGHDYNTSQEIRKLEARRAKGLKRGI